MSTPVELRRLLGNPALMIGVCSVVALLAMGMFGGTLAPHDPNAGTSLIIRDLPNGNTAIKVPPTYPDPEHWFGTDQLGRDQWSRVLAGARLTLTVVLAATLVRLAIGFVLGLAVGWYGGPLVRAVRIAAAGVTAIPQLLLAIMLVLVLRPFGVAGFIAALALVGWPEIVEFLRAEVRHTKTLPFMEAARSIGTADRRLVTGHLVAALSPQLLTVAALEAGSVLLLLAELGLVGIFLAGATFLIDDAGQPLGLKERAAEWGQMLGSIQFYAVQEQLATLIPAVFVVLAATAFALLADGLRAASDPFSPRRLLPGTFGVLAKVMTGALCFSAVGFFAFNIPTSVLTMEQGRELAAKTAQSTWPGSEYVAGVVRYSSSSHGIEKPERITYYFRNDRNEVLRISYLNGDALSVEVRKFETEDEIDFTAVKPLPAGLGSYDVPLARAEANGGSSFRQVMANNLVRAIVTWPNDRDAPIYSVTYGTNNRGQLTLRRICCFDAKTGVAIDSVTTPRIDPPWPVPSDCPISRIVVQQPDRVPAYFAQGGQGLAVGSFFNLYFSGDNSIQTSGGVGVAVIESAVNLTSGEGSAKLVNAQQTAGNGIAFAQLRFTTFGCWKLRAVVGAATQDLVVYVYPAACRPPQLQQALPPEVRLDKCEKP
ncbi:MAG: ABC transporter permease [Chloroflexota bacterium]|nr:ABC transporter permease [Chloroflexota bacterium]